MFCKNCGKEIREGKQFCGECGNPIDINNSQIINNKKPKKKFKNIIIAVIGVFAILILIGIFAGENEYVSAVKNGTFNNYPDVLIGDAFDDFFSNPKWKHFVSDDGINVVEFTGGCKYDDVDVKALLQFIVYEDDTFESSYFSMNDISQNLLMMSGLLDKVIGEYSGEQSALSVEAEENSLEDYFSELEIAILTSNVKYKEFNDTEKFVIDGLLSIWYEDYSSNFSEYNKRIDKLIEQQNEYIDQTVAGDAGVNPSIKADDYEEPNWEEYSDEGKKQYLLKLYTIEEYLNNEQANELKIYETWDYELNKIYNLLKDTLSESEMNNLTDEQITWISYRDETAQNLAKGEAEQYKEGRLNFELGRLTKERCYELVNNYL